MPDDITSRNCFHRVSGTENVLNPEKPENPKNLYKFKKAPLREGPNQSK